MNIYVSSLFLEMCCLKDSLQWRHMDEESRLPPEVVITRVRTTSYFRKHSSVKLPRLSVDQCGGWLLPFVSWLRLISSTVPTFMSDWLASWRPTAAVPLRSLRAWRPSGGRSSLCCGSVSSELGTVGESPPAHKHTHSDGLTVNITRLTLPNGY